MTNIQNHEATKEAVKKRYRGHTVLYGKTKPQYPLSAEREFKRVTDAYIKLLNAELKKRLPQLMAAYRLHRNDAANYDDYQDLERLAREIFLEIAAKLEQLFVKFDLGKRISEIAQQTKKISLREWRRVVHETLGIDLLSEYYTDGFYEEYIRRWIDQNVLLIKSIPNQTLDTMRQIILDSYANGKLTRDVQREIQKEYLTTKQKARLLARDQLAKLNADISQAQQQDAGVNRYRWSDSDDERVRKCHAELDGQIFSWDEPPEMWYDTKSKGRVYTGRRCHPGQDICCRCVAIPVFDIDTLDLPMKGKQKDGKAVQ